MANRKNADLALSALGDPISLRQRPVPVSVNPMGTHALFAYNNPPAGLSVHELAAVLAHELAHLSQRHYARGVEYQRKATLPYLAAMLASIALMATVGGDAGLAALSSTQAAAQDSSLRFSRTREQEADRCIRDEADEQSAEAAAVKVEILPRNRAATGARARGAASGGG